MIEIGSRHAAAIMGVSPHLTPWQAWAQLVGILPEHEATEVMDAGTALEPFVLSMFEARSDWKLYETPSRKVNGWQRSTADGKGDRYSPQYERAVFEVKCVVHMPPTAPRVDWVVQSLHHLLVHEDAVCCVIVCFGGLQLRHWVVPRHERAMAALLRAEEAFLKLVETETPPPVRAEDSALIHKRWPFTRPETVVLGWDEVEQDLRRQASANTLAIHQKLKDEADAKLKDAIGEHERAVLPNGVRYSFLPYQRNGKTYRTLRRSGGDDE